MANTKIGGVYVVAATKAGKTEYWAAATRSEGAVEAVREQLPPGWTAEMTDRRLDPAKATSLKMRLNSVRKLKGAP